MRRRKAGGPTAGEAQYGLVDLLVHWWPRRTLFDTLFYDSLGTYTYKLDDKTYVAKFPRNFVDENAEQGDGRTPWGVLWKPGDNKQHTDVAQGMFFIDPPAYLTTRHGNAYFETAFSAEAKTGFSADWCFNPYLGIDNRGTGDVCPQ